MRPHASPLHHPIAPIPCKPWTLNGLPDRLIVSHYENIYGAAVRSLNAVRDRLAALDLAAAPGHEVRELKREELAARGSVVLHELYFGNLGGDGKIAAPVATVLEQHFGGADAWRREFVAVAQALGGGSGWVLLSYSRRDRRLYNQIAFDHSQTMVDAAPLLVLDMYEHAYHLEFGANAMAYIDAFMRNIDWTTVGNRLMEAGGDPPGAPGGSTEDSLPSISVEELAAQLARGERLKLLDARPRHYVSKATDMMAGAIWRDPDRVEEWSSELSADTPVVVYCAHGFHVGCGVTKTLRERGVDARYVRGGLSAWYGIGGARALRSESRE